MPKEQIREALMRLSMCARKECEICKYKDRPKSELPSDGCKERATKNINILADVCLKERNRDMPKEENNASLLTWCYCNKCGRKITIGETCFDVGIDTYCSDCCTEVNTLDFCSDGRRDER